MISYGKVAKRPKKRANKPAVTAMVESSPVSETEIENNLIDAVSKGRRGKKKGVSTMMRGARSLG